MIIAFIAAPCFAAHVMGGAIASLSPSEKITPMPPRKETFFDKWGLCIFASATGLMLASIPASLIYIAYRFACFHAHIQL